MDAYLHMDAYLQRSCAKKRHFRARTGGLQAMIARSLRSHSSLRCVALEIQAIGKSYVNWYFEWKCIVFLPVFIRFGYWGWIRSGVEIQSALLMRWCRDLFWGLTFSVNRILYINYIALAIVIVNLMIHIAYCLLPTAYCLLPTAYCLLPIACCTFQSPRRLFVYIQV